MKAKILIVDDDVHVQGVMISVLQLWKYRHVSAHSVDEALKSLVTHSDITLAFIDGNLVGGTHQLDTEDLVRAIRAQHSHIKLVAHSARAEWNHALIAAGCDAALPKPVREIDDIHNLIICLLK